MVKIYMQGQMLEAHTRRLRRDELATVLWNAARDRSFRALATEDNHLTFRSESLPSLEAYTIDDFPPIGIKCEERVDYPEFWAVTRRLAHESLPSLCYIDVSECGVKFDPTDEQDVELGFGLGFCGPMVMLSTGGVTPGATDLTYRRDLFNRFLQALGLHGRIEVMLVDGELDMHVSDPSFRNARDFPRNELPKVRAQGRPLFEGRTTNTKGRNFRHLYLYCFTLDQLARKVPDVVEALGGQDRVVASRFDTGCTKENYPELRGILNDSPFGPWEIRFCAVAKYSLDNLDQAVAENESFLFRAFTLSPPGIGEVDVNIYYNKGAFWLHFTCEYESNEQEKALQDLIIKFADGEDIIDHAML